VWRWKIQLGLTEFISSDRCFTFRMRDDLLTDDLATNDLAINDLVTNDRILDDRAFDDRLAAADPDERRCGVCDSS
jgi:hypothetical protein